MASSLRDWVDFGFQRRWAQRHGSRPAHAAPAWLKTKIHASQYVYLNAECSKKNGAPFGTPYGIKWCFDLCATRVGAVCSVHLDRFTFLDEEWHLNGQAGFKGCWLLYVAGGVPFHSFGGFGDFHFDRGWQID